MSWGFGGGQFPTLVITNHGPCGVEYETPYNPYSLLRTLEDVCAIGEHLGHAGETAAGVQPTVALFSASGR